MDFLIFSEVINWGIAKKYDAVNKYSPKKRPPFKGAWLN
jgi:hypothetical protein